MEKSDASVKTLSLARIGVSTALVRSYDVPVVTERSESSQDGVATHTLPTSNLLSFFAFRGVEMSEISEMKRRLVEGITRLVEEDEVVFVPVTVRSNTAPYDHKTERHIFIVSKPSRMRDLELEGLNLRGIIARGIGLPVAELFPRLEERDVIDVMEELRKRYVVKRVPEWLLRLL